MRTLYFDCFSGISGDMILGSLLDISGAEAVLQEGLAKLGLQDEFELKITKKTKNGIGGTDVDVILKEHHHHDHHHDHHHHRNLQDIIKIIEASTLSDQVKETGKKVFIRLAEAEACVHQTTIEAIHFHEVGATDAIVDIMGTCILVDHLGVDRILCSPLHDGNGFTKCAHGVIPVPVPAVIEITTRRGAPLKIIDSDQELVTPTGAALICELADEFTAQALFSKGKVGYGCGKRESDRPNLLRTILTEEPMESKKLLLETNLDDTTGEILAYTMERLFKAGALDVWFESILMKKNRPAYKLCILTSQSQAEALKEIVFFETTAIGIREHQVSRTELTRSIEMINTPYGEIEVKKSHFQTGEKLAPEFESAKRKAEKLGVPLREIYSKI